MLVLYAKVDLLMAPQFHWDLAWQCVFRTASVASLYWAITQTTLFDAAAIAATSPVVVAVLGAWVRQEHIGLLQVGAAFTALIGVVFVAWPNVIFEVPIISYGSPYAALGAAGSCVFAALAEVHVRKLTSLPTLVVAHYALLVGAAISGVWVLLAQGVRTVLVSLSNIDTSIVVCF